MAFSPPAPCKDCDTRTMGCHATCGDYKTWREERDALVNRERAIRKGEEDYKALKVGIADSIDKKQRVKKRRRGQL